MCIHVLLTPSTCIGFTALSYFELLLTPSTYIVFDGIFGKSQVSEMCKTILSFLGGLS